MFIPLIYSIVVYLIIGILFSLLFISKYKNGKCEFKNILNVIFFWLPNIIKNSKKSH